MGFFCRHGTVHGVIQSQQLKAGLIDPYPTNKGHSSHFSAGLTGHFHDECVVMQSTANFAASGGYLLLIRLDRLGHTLNDVQVPFSRCLGCHGPGRVNQWIKHLVPQPDEIPLG